MTTQRLNITTINKLYKKIMEQYTCSKTEQLIYDKIELLFNINNELEDIKEISNCKAKEITLLLHNAEKGRLLLELLELVKDYDKETAKAIYNDNVSYINKLKKEVE